MSSSKLNSILFRRPLIETSKIKTRNFRGALVQFKMVNVLLQVRKTFDQEEIRLLAESIAHTGVIQPSIMALFDENHMQEYLNLNNDVNHCNVQLSDLISFTQKKKKKYILVLAGERRFRAHHYLWHVGCKDCNDNNHGSLAAGQCFQKHFGSSYMEARLCENVLAETGKDYQFQENNYVPPPSHEIAYHYYEYFQTLSIIYKRRQQHLTMREFAKKVGRSEGTIRNAMIFVSLPAYIREAVEKKKVSYTVAIEFNRLIANKVSKLILRNFFLNICSQFNIKAETVREKITAYIVDLSLPTFDFGEVDRTPARVMRRRTVQRELIPILLQMVDYLHRVQGMYEKGSLGKDRSIYSEVSVKNMVQRFTKAVASLLPHTEGKGINIHQVLLDLQKIERHAKRLKPAISKV